MATHTVHKSTETGNFVVADKDGKILHTFPSEGEANLQVVALEQAEEAAQAKAKEEAEAKAKETKAEAKEAKEAKASDKNEDEGKSAQHARHR